MSLLIQSTYHIPRVLRTSYRPLGVRYHNYLPSDVTLFETLRTMNEVRPFELVFLIEVFGIYQEESRQELTGALDSTIAAGLFDFLESLPNILSSVQRRWL